MCTAYAYTYIDILLNSVFCFTKHEVFTCILDTNCILQFIRRNHQPLKFFRKIYNFILYNYPNSIT